MFYFGKCQAGKYFSVFNGPVEGLGLIRLLLKLADEIAKVCEVLKCIAPLRILRCQVKSELFNQRWTQSNANQG